MTNWHYVEGGERKGPISEEELQILIPTLVTGKDTLVWKDGMTDWSAYSSVMESSPTEEPQQAAAGEANCVECGKAFPLQDMLTYEGSTICAACKPVYFQKLQEGVSLPGTFQYGGFWIRFAAKVIDGFVLLIINLIITSVAGLLGFKAASMGPGEDMSTIVITQVMMALLQLGVGVAFTVFFLGKFGATPGKMACKLKVIRSDGSRITYGRAFGRHFAEMLSQIILYIGYIMAAFDEEKRTLHDRICDTRVVVVD